MHIVVPAINYDNHYTTRIEFDKEATSGNVNTNTSDEQKPVSTPSKDDDTKGHDAQNVQHNQTTPSDAQNPNLRMLHLEKIVQQIIVHQLPHLQIKL